MLNPRGIQKEQLDNLLYMSNWVKWPTIDSWALPIQFKSVFFFFETEECRIMRLNEPEWFASFHLLWSSYVHVLQRRVARLGSRRCLCGPAYPQQKPCHPASGKEVGRARDDRPKDLGEKKRYGFGKWPFRQGPKKGKGWLYHIICFIVVLITIHSDGDWSWPNLEAIQNQVLVQYMLDGFRVLYTKYTL